jgi:uncharacterized membrane protein
MLAALHDLAWFVLGALTIRATDAVIAWLIQRRHNNVVRQILQQQQEGLRAADHAGVGRVWRNAASPWEA